MANWDWRTGMSLERSNPVLAERVGVSAPNRHDVGMGAVRKHWQDAAGACPIASAEGGAAMIWSLFAIRYSPFATRRLPNGDCHA
jgi:hypothetical protein